MSCEASSNVAKEKSVLWLGTYYFNLKPHNISNMSYDVIWKSEKVRPNYVNILLEFQFVRISELEFRVTCIRAEENYVPSFYNLQFRCWINVFEEPIRFELHSEIFLVFQKIFLDDSYRQNMASSDLKKEFEIKVLVRMIEYDCASTPEYFRQEAYFQDQRRKFFNFNPDDLCYILHIQKLEDIFTGRQKFEFAEMKTKCISRAAHYANRIAHHMKANSRMSPIELGCMLNGIVNGVEKPIKDKDLIEVYYEAYLMGLDFLVNICQEVIFDRLGNRNFMIEAMNAAHHVADETLFRIVADKFEIQTQMENFEFRAKAESFGFQGRFMYRCVMRYKRMNEPASRVQTGELLQPSTSAQYFQ